MRLSGDATAGALTLSFEHEGITYTTQAIALDASLAEVQAAINAGFAIQGALIQVTAWTGRALSVRFAGTLVGQDVALMEVQTEAAVAAVELQTIEVGSTTTTGAVAEHTVVVDYAVAGDDLDGLATDLSVRTEIGRAHV